MTAHVIPIQTATRSAPAPLEAVEPVDELLAERTKIEAELSRLGVVDARLAEAEARLAEIEVALQAIDRADIEQMRVWADTGEGEPPRPLIEERRALLARRLDAQAEAEGARNAVAAVAEKKSMLVAAFQRIERQRWFCRLDTMLSEAERLNAQAGEIVKTLAEPMMQLAGLRLALVDYISTSQPGELQQRAGAAIERLDAFARLNLAGDAAMANSFARAWREKLR